MQILYLIAVQELYVWKVLFFINSYREIVLIATEKLSKNAKVLPITMTSITMIDFFQVFAEFIILLLYGTWIYLMR